MRGLLAGLLVALIISTVALLVATIGAVGVAAIGLLLNRWFDLTQWQGTIIASGRNDGPGLPGLQAGVSGSCRAAVEWRSGRVG